MRAKDNAVVVFVENLVGPRVIVVTLWFGACVTSKVFLPSIAAATNRIPEVTAQWCAGMMGLPIN